MDDHLIDLASETLIITLKVVAPILAAGVVVGLVISIIQSVTSIQEQTIAFVPKIVAMVVVAVMLIPWIMSRLVAFTTELFTGW